jgi:hypothetical protein
MQCLKRVDRIDLTVVSSYLYVTFWGVTDCGSTAFASC